MHAAPFVPFSIHLADGGQLRVPTVDLVAISPTGGSPTLRFRDETRNEIVNNNGTLTSHSDVGKSVFKGNINNAYDWIRDSAVAAGVRF